MKARLTGYAREHGKAALRVAGIVLGVLTLLFLAGIFPPLGIALGVLLFLAVAYLRNPLVAHKSPRVVCPHCQTRGSVRVITGTVKRGIHGGKATGALFTAGTSMLFTGLSRQQRVTQATCEHCGMEWTIE